MADFRGRMAIRSSEREGTTGRANLGIRIRTLQNKNNGEALQSKVSAKEKKLILRDTGSGGKCAVTSEKKEWSGRKDLNLRPPGPEPGALARLRYAPTATRVLQTKRELQLNTGDCCRGTPIRREEAFVKEIGGGSHPRNGNAGRAKASPRKLERHSLRSCTAAQTPLRAGGSKCWRICRSFRTYRWQEVYSRHRSARSL
jgi:hypothetical protein